MISNVGNIPNYTFSGNNFSPAKTMPTEYTKNTILSTKKDKTPYILTFAIGSVLALTTIIAVKGQVKKILDGEKTKDLINEIKNNLANLASSIQQYRQDRHLAAKHSTLQSLLNQNSNN